MSLTYEPSSEPLHISCSSIEAVHHVAVRRSEKWRGGGRKWRGGARITGVHDPARSRSVFEAPLLVASGWVPLSNPLRDVVIYWYLMNLVSCLGAPVQGYLAHKKLPT